MQPQKDPARQSGAGPTWGYPSRMTAPTRATPLASGMKTERESGAEYSALVAFTLCWEKSFILAVVNVLKVETSYDVGRDPVHRRCPDTHAR